MSLANWLGIHIFVGKTEYIIKVRKRLFLIAKPWAQPDKLMREYYWWTYGGRVVGFIIGLVGGPLIVLLASVYLF